MTYHVQTKLSLAVYQSTLGTPDESKAVLLELGVLAAKLTKNNHREADVLTVTVSYREGGIDPRQLIDATCAFSMWDANREDWDPAKHVRFTGICKTAERKLGESSSAVELTFHDFTTLFLAAKPFKPSGIPEWTDSLRSAWVRICNHTGWEDPAMGEIVSTVKIFTRPDGLIFYPPDLEERLIGEMVAPRFRAISKPTPPDRCDAWGVWRWIVESLGFVTFIDRDQCVVSSLNEFYRTAGGTSTTPGQAIYGQNIWDFEEKADTTITAKGILLKSYDPLEGRLIEAFYPPPGDPRIKTKRGAAGKKSEGGAVITENEACGQYEEHTYPITDKATLQAKAQSAFEERQRQAMTGKFKTAEMFLDDVDILELRSGAPIIVRVDPESLETLLSLGSFPERVSYLVEICGHDPGTAQVLARNADVLELHDPIFHVDSLEVDYGPERFECEIRVHNRIVEIVKS